MRPTPIPMATACRIFRRFTNTSPIPRASDTAGGGISDGDWNQRREFNYSVRAVIRVMPPYNPEAINDDYQDGRVLDEKPGFAELEIVVYPLNTNAEAIKGNPNWKSDYAGMQEFLAPGATTNWDAAMRETLLGGLADGGIHPDKLTDKELVERVSRWIFKRAQFRKMFCTFFVTFPNGQPALIPGLEKAFERERGDSKWTPADEFEHELLGRQMYANRTYGTCTSVAVYQATVLRALGIPTRMILCIPLGDGSDGAQTEMINKNLTHHEVRRDAYLGALAGGRSFASHTFCEAFVGGRWRRLNYSKLGQNVLDSKTLGLMLKIHSFGDLADANLAPTWGYRYGKGLRDELFPYSNPYRLIEVSDHFGKNASIPNPPADFELHLVTITKAYLEDSSEAPIEVQKAAAKRKFKPEGSFYVHCLEWLEDGGGWTQYKLFMQRADRSFVLRAEGHPDVSCRISGNSYAGRSPDLCELELMIPPEEYAKMVPDLAYTIHPVNGNEGYRWQVSDGVTITRR